MRLALAAVTLAAIAAFAGGMPITLTFDKQAALTTIDTVPSSDDLAGKALAVPDDLVTIAADPDIDSGVRLRAIHGLAVYCTTPGNGCPDSGPVHQTLSALVTATAGARSGSDLLMLRAAIEADGPLKLPDDLQLFRDLHLLDHPSRDIRAATARALAELRNCQATSDLRLRYQNESTDQVKLAISETLRILSQPGYCLVQ